MSQKNMYMANFNCTFGDNYLPMLDYFEDIILPAFTDNYEKKTSKNKFFFHNVKIIEYSENKYALSGIIVKQTVLEIKSLIDDKTGDIIKKDDKIPSDPFSYFIIFLENHRMVLIKNQSGSPSLKDFERLSKYALKESCDDDITINLNIGSIPSSSKVDEELSRIKNIQTVTLKLYPLNGDVDNIYGGLREELKEFGCDEGFTTFKNPKNPDEVKKTLISGKGIFKPTIVGRGDRGQKITITDYNVASILPIFIDENIGVDENIENIIEQVEDEKDLKELSEENKGKYSEKLGIIKMLFNKQKK